MSEQRPCAVLRPVRIERWRKYSGRRGSYVWLEGYAVTPPGEREMLPHMTKSGARAFCRSQGWAVRVKGAARARR
jgi:hypothetical protein